MKKCIFCDIIAKKDEHIKEDIVFEDDRVLVMLDEDWAVKGHTLVIWKEHFKNASELPLNDYLYFSNIFHRTEKALLSVLGTEKSVILKTGELVSHFHFHIYPLSKEANWQAIKEIFDKKVSYEFKSEEKQDLINSLRRQLMLK